MPVIYAITGSAPTRGGRSPQRWKLRTNALSYLEEWETDEIGSMRRYRLHNEPNALPRVYSYFDQRLQTTETDTTGILLDVGMITDSIYNEYDGADVIASGTWQTRFSSTGTWDFYASVAAQSFYDAAGQLRAHQRYTGQNIEFGDRRDGIYEEYRYDALGRRVLVRSRRPSTLCNHSQCHSAIERFVWDGAEILHELRAPGADGNDLEATTGSLPYYGRVTHTHGRAIDRPLGVIRQATGSSDHAIIPHLDWRGQFDRGTTATGAASTANIAWPGDARRTYHDQKAEAESAPAPSWYGSLIVDQKDGSGLVYRRNRYYDPMTGRFTQEDPIGIAGGINLYGFAEGDPVSFTDPFGLQACPRDIDITECPEASGGVREPLFDPVALLAGGVVGGIVGGLKALTISRGASAGARLGADVAETFAGRIHRRVLQSDVTAVRYSGGVSKPVGRFLTTEGTAAQIVSAEAAKAALNLPQGATAEALHRFIIPRGTEVFVGRVAGGAPWATQIFVRNPSVLMPVR